MRYNPSDTELDTDIILFNIKDALAERHDLTEKLIYSRQKIETVTRERFLRLMEFHELPCNFAIHIENNELSVWIGSFWSGVTQDICYVPVLGGPKEAWKAFEHQNLKDITDREFFRDRYLPLKTLSEIKSLLSEWEIVLAAKITVNIVTYESNQWVYIPIRDLP